MDKYEFNIRMYAKICEAYSLIKQSDVEGVQRKFDEIMSALKEFHK